MRKKTICLSQSLLLGIVLSACGAAASPSPTVLPDAPTRAAGAATVTPAPTASPAVPASTPAPAATAVPATEPAASNLSGSVTLTWWGQACFVLSGGELRVLLDPTSSGTGYTIPPQSSIDLVTVSHEHSDHNAVNIAAGSPLVLKGLTGGDWAKIDQTVKSVRVRTVGVYHDEQQGGARGKNAVFIFDFNGLRVAHLGDLGHILSPEQLAQIGQVEVVMVPVGGFYTIDAKTAAQVVQQLKPRVVIPMHYKTAALSASLAGQLAPVDDFLKAMGDQAALTTVGQTVTLEKDKLPDRLTVMVLQYKP